MSEDRRVTYLTFFYNVRYGKNEVKKSEKSGKIELLCDSVVYTSGNLVYALHILRRASMSVQSKDLVPNFGNDFWIV